MRPIQTIAMVTVLAVPISAAAECSPKNEIDCCYRDADCVAYAYPAVCQVLALPEAKVVELKAAAELARNQSPIRCDGSRLEALKERARRAEAKCDDGTCRLFDFGL